MGRGAMRGVASATGATSALDPGSTSPTSGSPGSPCAAPSSPRRWRDTSETKSAKGQHQIAIEPVTIEALKAPADRTRFRRFDWEPTVGCV